MDDLSETNIEEVAGIENKAREMIGAWKWSHPRQDRDVIQELYNETGSSRSRLLTAYILRGLNAAEARSFIAMLEECV